MFNILTVLLAVFICMGVLFLLALYVERCAAAGKNLSDHPLVYSLSLGVFITTWSYYGSVGQAVTSGMLFITISLGATLSMVLWWTMVRKMVRLRNRHRITNIADLIAARYGKSRSLAAIATIIALVGIMPYLGLQLKAVTSTFSLITRSSVGQSVWNEQHVGILISVLMIMFTIIFGVRRIDPTERHQGIVMAVAMESLIKLAAFLAVGLLATFVVYHGPEDLFQQFTDLHYHFLVTPHKTTASDSVTWVTWIILAMSAAIFLPRQFHVAVVENFRERHLRTAMWLFPLYLLLMNLFVLPIAMAGLMAGLPATEADTFVLRLPVLANQQWLSLFVFIGGFSAAAAMIMVCTMSLATMTTNHLLLPLTEWLNALTFLRRHLLRTRWGAVTLIMLGGYWFNVQLGGTHMLVNLGLISFAAVLQFVPAVVGGLFWRKGSKIGAVLGLSSGFLVWAYTLLLPAFCRSNRLGDYLLDQGPWGIEWLNPEKIGGLSGFDPLSHAVFWTLFFNIGLYIWGSLLWPANEEEKRILSDFVESAPSRVARGRSIHDQPKIDAGEKKQIFMALLAQYLPPLQAAGLLDRSFQAAGVLGRNKISIIELADIHGDVERQLAGSIGAGAAHWALKQKTVFSPQESQELTEVYAEILAQLKVTPAELKRRIDYHRDREKLLGRQAEELTERVRDREREIAERKRIEKALRESEERSRAILEASPNPIVVYDDMGRVNYLNPAFTRVFGWTVDELMGRKIDFVPEDLLNEAQDKIQTAYRQESGSISFETKRYTKTRNLLDVNISAAVFGHPDGRPVGMVVNLTDITERKQAEWAVRESEERYRDLFNNITDYIYTHDLQGRILSVNPAVSAGLGYSWEELVGRPWRDFMFPDDQDGPYQEYLVKIGRNDRVEGLLTLLSKGGDKVYIEYRNTLVYQDGKPTHVNGSGRDVTAQVMAKRKLKAVQEQLLQAQKMEAVGTLASGIAHDFNNLLQAMSGYIQLLLAKGGQDATSHSYLKEVDHAVGRAAELVRSLLTFSRKVAPDLRPVDLNREITQTVGMLQRTIPKMIHIDLALDRSLKMINADPNQLDMVLVNLVTNARDAMPDGGRILIQTGNVPMMEQDEQTLSSVSPGDQVLLLVSDNGQGMDEKTVQHIFEPFFTTKAVGSGTGLGLSTAYGIIKGHGGHITCQSRIGQGTTFKIYLPAMQMDAPVCDISEPTVSAMPAGEGAILLVDDETAIREIAREILSAHGYRIFEAASGEGALDFFRMAAEKVDLVIMDLGMPGMGGLNCLQELLKMEPGLRVIIASGYAADVKVQEALDRGAKAFLSKPYRLQSMIQKVDEVLGMKP